MKTGVFLSSPFPKRRRFIKTARKVGLYVIVRPGLFRLVLLEGIGLGCLAPDKTLAWEWMETAAVNNDPATFMDDMDRYYDLLAAAAENGVAEARRLMDRIWEPEQIIEED